MAHYYADGKRISIEADTAHVAVDQARVGKDELSLLLGSVLGSSPHVPGGLLVVPRAALDPRALERLTALGALRPVYRRGHALMVPLPQVRVELEGEAQRRAVLEAIPRSPYQVRIADDRPEYLTLDVPSGDGDEALSVANFLYETAHPAASSVRFVQFVPRPEPRGAR